MIDVDSKVLQRGVTLENISSRICDLLPWKATSTSIQETLLPTSSLQWRRLLTFPPAVHRPRCRAGDRRSSSRWMKRVTNQWSLVRPRRHQSRHSGKRLAQTAARRRVNTPSLRGAPCRVFIRTNCKTRCSRSMVRSSPQTVASLQRPAKRSSRTQRMHGTP